jgi:hypothetical protein
MLVSCGKNMTLIASKDHPAVAVTAAQPLGENNKVNVAMTIHTIFLEGTGSIAVTLAGELSNDGENWYDTPDFNISESTVQTKSKSATADATFIRFRLTLEITGGSTGDWGVAILDVFANLTQAPGS